MTIIVDSREPPAYKKLATKGEDGNPMIETFDCGDFYIFGECDKFMLERKTLNDLMNSLRDGRLWTQVGKLKELKEQGITPIVVAEGNMYWAFKSKLITLPQWHGIQLGIAKFGVSFMFCNTKGALLELIDQIEKKCGKKVEYVAPTVAKPKDRPIEQERIDMLTGIDGIGGKTAKKIVDEYGTIGNIVNSYNDQQIDTLGKILGKKKDHFIEVVIGVKSEG